MSNLININNVSSFRGYPVTNGEIDAYDAYDEYLDSEGTVDVMGMEFFPSRIISELDPTAYRCGYNDWVDDIQRKFEDAFEDEDYSEIEWIEEIDAYDAYDEYLDSEGTVDVMGMEFFPSRIISELDPTAYSCGYNDWVDDIQRDMEDAIENEDHSEIEWIKDPDFDEEY